MLLTNSLEIIEKILGMCTDACRAQGGMCSSYHCWSYLKGHSGVFFNVVELKHIYKTSQLVMRCNMSKPVCVTQTEQINDNIMAPLHFICNTEFA